MEGRPSTFDEMEAGLKHPDLGKLSGGWLLDGPSSVSGCMKPVTLRRRTSTLSIHGQGSLWVYRGMQPVGDN